MLWTVKDLSQRLQVKPSTLYAWTAQGKIPYLRIHGVVRSHKEEIVPHGKTSGRAGSGEIAHDEKSR